ncbi:MAG: tyrosine--tRNA ligase [Patescibacteria group bacterium]|nr:tyrosine--tRNA ligase [Patescibacteria group bacterium]MBU1062545.1 tyrosine--tRNA ligase [Patescibacteria group bacterium]MBU2081395.1 tyrosine--tRNA ligase [Patescibacteria group bacterium]MBU2214667.1 tyrosine--tRNA ligase [Patescibacteria group bacterium]MBU2250352.1 tyrosine--tRNA ligase [Patescibacteria group bacterium]
MLKTIVDEEKIDEILSRGVDEIINKEHLRKRLLSGEKLRIKCGIDPTSPNLHLGRAVALLKLKDLQDLGHQIVLIIGDTTGVIGDTSDKDSERPMLTREIVQKNLATYKEQAGKILDMKKTEFHYNSEWLLKLGYNEIGEHADQFSLAEFIARENIKKRLEQGKRISLREVLYPLMQGYDSVAIKADLEIGGTDQRFNLLAGRDLQKYFKQEVQDVLMVNLIEGIDGRKMSSSWSNTINILDILNEMFGKIMSMPDDLIIKYFIHCTRVQIEKIKQMEIGMKNEKVNPRDAKLELATEIVKMYYDEKEAEKAKEYFINTFSKKEIPEEVKSQKLKVESINIVELLASVNLATSKNEARRLVEQGGVKVDGAVVKDINKIIKITEKGSLIQRGKRQFVRVIKG